MTDLHDEIRTRLKKKQGRGRIIGDLLDDKNYAHLDMGVLGSAYDEVLAEPAVAACVDGIYLDRHATTAALGAAAAGYLKAVREPILVHGALRWTRPDYSAPITDTAGPAWKGAWQAVPWHDGKHPVRRSPPVDGVAFEALMASSPVVRAGGCAWTRDGWVSARGVSAGYYCVEDVRDVAIDGDPIDHLWTLFQDFPFVDVDARKRVMAALLTGAALPSIDGPIPAFLICAHNPGDGKTLLAQVISMVLDSESVVVPWHDDEDRTRELLLSAIDSPSRIVILDNVRGRLGGSILETILTATEIIGSRKYERARRYTVNKLIMVTGNDPRVTPDMARRLVRIQVDRAGALPPADLPEVLVMARQRRAEWLSCVRAVLESWDRVKRPIHGCRSYEAWSGLIGGVLGNDWTPIDAALVAAEHDPEALEWMPVMEAMHSRQSESPMGVTDMIAATGKAVWDGLLRGGRGTTEAQVGALLARVAGRAIGHYRIVRTEVQIHTSDGPRMKGRYHVEYIGRESITTDEDTPF